MTDYAILRLRKIKTASHITNAAKHHCRTVDMRDPRRGVPNADPHRRCLNRVLVGTRGLWSDLAAVAAVARRLPEKVRTNAVLVLEYLVTASPTFNGDWDGYFSKAIDYLRQKHGTENVVFAVALKDTTTPHMFVWAVPLLDGKLNAKFFTGTDKGRFVKGGEAKVGTKSGSEKLRALQTDFASKVGAQFGLTRGIQREKRATPCAEAPDGG